MSRRCHHGSPRHAHPIGRVPRRPAATSPNGAPLSSASQPLPVPPVALEPVRVVEAPPIEASAADQAPSVDAMRAVAEPVPVAPAIAAAAPGPASAPRAAAPALMTPPVALPVPPRPANGIQDQQPRPAQRNGVPHDAPSRAPHDAPTEHQDGEQGERGATGPQLRRFIKSRAYVPMHELRRRFLINGGDDEVTPVDLGERRRVFVGLPEREGRLLGELLRGGDIGYELSLDPISPIVVGVYPMRPVTRA